MRNPILFLISTLALASLASAQTTFTGSLNTDFATTANWSTGLPGSGNDGTINGGLTADLASAHSAGTSTTTIGAGGTAGTLNINNGGTLSTVNGGTSDVRVGVGAGSVGTVNINSGGTLSVLGVGADVFLGDAAGGQGFVNVNAGGTLDARKALEIINGTLSLATTATVAANTPKDEFVVDNSGILAFATDGASVATIPGSSLALELGSTSTLHMNLGGDFVQGDTWTLFTGISGFSGVAGGDGTGVFGTVTDPSNPSFVFTVHYGTAPAAADEVVVELTTGPTAPDPRMQVDASYSFTTNGAASVPSITVTNLGLTLDLNITSVTATETGTATPESTVSGILADTPVAFGGGTGIIDFDFTPTGPGVYTFDLNIFSDDAEEASPRVIPFTIEVFEPLISANASAFDLGILPNNPGDQVSIITVSNTSDGTLDLNITGTTMWGDTAEFVVTATPGPIAPGLTGDIEVTFNPGTASGVFTATLDIQSDDYNGDVPQVTFVAFVEPTDSPAARTDFGTTASLVQPGYTQFISAEDASMIVEGVTITLDSRDGNITAGARGDGDPDDLRSDTAQTGGASGGDYLSVILSGFNDGTLNLVTSHNLAGNNFTVPMEVLFGEQGGVLTSVATSVRREDWVEHTVAVEAGKTYELRMADTSVANECYISSLLMWGDAVPGGSPGFGSWAGDNGIPADPNGDFDKDGIVELVEYGVGSNPTVPGGDPATLTGLLLSYSKGAEAVSNGDVTWAIETSTDLGITDPWTTVTPDVNDATTISYTLPSGPGETLRTPESDPNPVSISNLRNAQYRK